MGRNFTSQSGHLDTAYRRARPWGKTLAPRIYCIHTNTRAIRQAHGRRADFDRDLREKLSRLQLLDLWRATIAQALAAPADTRAAARCNLVRLRRRLLALKNRSPPFRHVGCGQSQRLANVRES